MARALRGIALGLGLASTLTFCGRAEPDEGAGFDEDTEEARASCDPAEPTCQALISRPPACPRLTKLSRVCVPLPGSGQSPVVIPPSSQCGAGFFASNKVDARRLFNDTILIKETGDATGERPVMTLFLGAERALLLDTGNNSLQTEQVVAPLLGGRPVEVINTHLHGDHIGRNPQFNVIAIATPEVEAHCGVTGYDSNAAAPCNNPVVYNPPNDQELFGFRNFKVVRVVRDGHRVDLGGREITVLATPGHSETSVTLVDPVKRLVFTGDTLYPGNNPPLVHPQTGSSYSLYAQTAERYRQLGPSTAVVVGAHGEGVMPARSLAAFADFMVEHTQNPATPDSFTDPQGCVSGNFVLGNNPKSP
jgi:glyoxylase-like metal-dependent hydrolase (beta-lactamase superfamily II)